MKAVYVNTFKLQFEWYLQKYSSKDKRIKIEQISTQEIDKNNQINA